MAHTFVTGGTTSSSERELAVGGSSATAIDLFDGLGYVALGHLHRPQEFHGGRVAYSGSPIPYSFSEEHDKSVRIVECGATIATRTLAVEVGRPVRTIRGTLQHLLHSPEFADAHDAWVRAELTDTSLQLGAVEALRQRFPHILELEQAGLRRQAPAALQATAERVTRTPVDIVDDYLAETFPDLDPDDTAFVHAAVTAALKDAE
jgi:exonuclease SbcD